MSTRDWDIFGPAGPLRRELERFASALLSDRGTAEQDDVWAPAVDIYEREDSLVLLVDLPGLERDDIDLQVEANALTIQGRGAEQRPSAASGSNGPRVAFGAPSGSAFRSTRPESAPATAPACWRFSCRRPPRRGPPV